MHPLIFSRNVPLSALFLLFAFILPATCRFHRSDHYWSGRPQPIGIDFTPNSAYAVYADSPDNFTLLGHAIPSPGNDYNQYVYELYRLRDKHHEDPFIPSSYDTFPVEKWMAYALNYIPCLLAYYRATYGTQLCVSFYKRWSNLDPTQLRVLCEPKRVYKPKNYRSRYLPALIRQWTTWPRSPIPYKNMTRSNFVLSIHSMIVDLKFQALRDHNITITSAIVSLPPWIYNERSDLVEEAFRLARIEVIEPPHSRIDAATMSTNATGPILVLDYGEYHFGIHRSTRKTQEYESGMSLQAPELDSIQFIYNLFRRLFDRYIKANGTQPALLRIEDQKPLAHIYAAPQLNQARALIKYGDGWPVDLPMDNRSLSVDVEVITGYPQTLNVTGEDIRVVECGFEQALSEKINTILVKRHAVLEYMKTLPEYTPELSLNDYYLLFSNIITNHPAPPSIKSWINHINGIVILASPYYTELLYKSIWKALGWDIYTFQQETCVPSYEIAARGVALRAREWVQMYDKEQDMYAYMARCRRGGYSAKRPEGCEDDTKGYAWGYNPDKEVDRGGVMGQWGAVVDLQRQGDREL